MRKRICIIHGVDTPPGDPWQEDFLWLYGIDDVEIYELNWPSVGFFTDGAKWLFSRRYREQVIDQLFVDHFTEIDGADLIITHSFGQVVMNAFFEDLEREPPCPIVNIAGPLTNPYLRLLYGSWAGYADGVEYHTILNPDDPITALRGRWFRNKNAESHLVISVDTDENEHPVNFYLDHPKVQDKILSLLKEKP
jgi:hypothetical protein